MKRFLLILISLVLFLPPLTQAGKLRDFEESATSNGNDDRDPEPLEEEEEEDDNYDDEEYYFAAEEDDYDVDFSPGKPLAPSLRVDAAYQETESDVEAVDLRLELGLDWAGLNYSETNYEEQDTGDKLELSYFHGVYRHQFSSQLEWHAGIGAVYLGGEEDNTGASITSPIIYRPLNWLAVELRPTWSSINANSIKDYDLGIHLGYGVAFFKVGYRWVESGDSNLDGAYIGASFKF